VDWDSILIIEVYVDWDSILIIEVYVDDIIFGSDDDRMSKKFAKDMQNEFEMSLLLILWSLREVFTPTCEPDENRRLQEARETLMKTQDCSFPSWCALQLQLVRRFGGG
jgi:hypothetical protein